MMRRMLVFPMAALSIAFAQLSAASQCLPNRPAVTVQIRTLSGIGVNRSSYTVHVRRPALHGPEASLRLLQVLDRRVLCPARYRLVLQAPWLRRAPVDISRSACPLLHRPRRCRSGR